MGFAPHPPPFSVLFLSPLFKGVLGASPLRVGQGGKRNLKPLSFPPTQESEIIITTSTTNYLYNAIPFLNSAMAFFNASSVSGVISFSLVIFLPISG